jgi:hypothetical protein
MKVCLACRSKRRDRIFSVGGRERKNMTSVKLVNHLQNAHLSDKQYKAYLVMEENRVVINENALGLTNDVVTGWWYTYMMIDHMLNL